MFLRKGDTAGSSAVIYSDSQLCVKTLNEWAPGWRRRGWTKASGGPVENQDLVVEAHDLYLLAEGRAKVEWLKGHAGSTWNEVADMLAGVAPAV